MKTAEERYTKQITCPAHPRLDHTATLFCHGHEFAGLWECPFGLSDSHDCEEFEPVETLATSWSPEIEDSVDVEGSVEACVECGVAREGDY